VTAVITIDAKDPELIQIALVGFTDLRGQTEALERVMNICKTHVGPKKRCVLMDARAIHGTLSASGRLMTINTLIANQDLLGRVLAGWAFVLDSPWNRGVITTISWLAPLSFPTKMFEAVDEARAWCALQLSSSSSS